MPSYSVDQSSLPSHPDKHSMMCSVTSSNFFFFQNSALPIENLNGKRLHILPERVRKRLDAIAVNGICGKKKKKKPTNPRHRPRLEEHNPSLKSHHICYGHHFSLVFNKAQTVGLLDSHQTLKSGNNLLVTTHVQE